VELIMTRTDKLCFDCLRRAGSKPSRMPDRVAPALLWFPVTLNNVNMVIQKAHFFISAFRAH